MDKDIKHKLVAERERAQLAQQVTDNPLVDEAYEMILDRIWHDWRRSAPEETDKRERLHMELNVVEKVRKRFNQIITTGKMAEEQLSDERNRTEH